MSRTTLFSGQNLRVILQSTHDRVNFKNKNWNSISVYLSQLSKLSKLYWCEWAYLSAMCTFSHLLALWLCWFSGKAEWLSFSLNTLYFWTVVFTRNVNCIFFARRVRLDSHLLKNTRNILLDFIQTISSLPCDRYFGQTEILSFSHNTLYLKCRFLTEM